MDTHGRPVRYPMPDPRRPAAERSGENDEVFASAGEGRHCVVLQPNRNGDRMSFVCAARLGEPDRAGFRHVIRKVADYVASLKEAAFRTTASGRYAGKG